MPKLLQSVKEQKFKAKKSRRGVNLPPPPLKASMVKGGGGGMERKLASRAKVGTTSVGHKSRNPSGEGC